MNYKTYTVEEFLSDESFRQWTNGTSAQASAFWDHWLAQNPDRMPVVRQAQELVRALNDHYQDDATPERFNHELNRLMESAAEHRDASMEAPVIPLQSRFQWRWAAAAAITVTVGLGLWLYGHVIPKSSLHADVYRQLTKAAPVPLQEKVNTGTRTLTVLLNDGSLVTLRPQSRLSYPKRFDKGNRTVYLKGEAFFNVVKNPASPFLIYANQTVTKVLGTSFLVRAFEEEKTVTVTVQTGRVSVYAQQEFEKAQQAGLRRIEGVVLTPNQQMTYNLDDNRLQKALVEKPKVVIPDAVSHEQVFDDTPVAKVFSTIEKTYGVKLIYNEDDLSACLINFTFSNESLLERLDVICQTIGASYEVLDGQIVITSKGCK
ncbi:FecR domain-containing protein [Spirosoma koreense]